MAKMHLFGRDNRPISRTREPKKHNKLIWFIIIGVIIFIFFRVQLLTILFFLVGFII